MGFECGGKVRVFGGAGQAGQGFGELLFCAVDIRQFMDEQIFGGLDRHGGTPSGKER